MASPTQRHFPIGRRSSDTQSLYNGVHSLKLSIHRFPAEGPGEGRRDFWEEGFLQVKPMFAKLINAKPSEIAFTGSTTIGENTILNGMDLRGGNVVTNDLHYT